MLREKQTTMLHYILIFFLLAVISACLGFGGLAGTFSQIAKVLSIFFLISLVISFVHYVIGRNRPPK